MLWLKKESCQTPCLKSSKIFLYTYDKLISFILIAVLYNLATTVLTPNCCFPLTPFLVHAKFLLSFWNTLPMANVSCHLDLSKKSPFQRPSLSTQPEIFFLFICLMTFNLSQHWNKCLMELKIFSILVPCYITNTRRATGFTV